MTQRKTITAVGLLSSGMDSALAIRLMLSQGIQMIAVTHSLPFSDDKADYPARVAEQLGVPLEKVVAGDDYIELVRSPRYGYGRNMNPCIDCRIYMLRGARQVAEKIGADFVVTGEVLGQRPMSQNLSSLMLEEKESGLKGLVLRPLTAKHLPETIPEREGWVRRDQLLNIKGRGRKTQLALARQFGLDGFRSPSGGCLLTSKEFSQKVRELFRQRENVQVRDIELLKIGRHFYSAGSRIVVGKNERENELLLTIKRDDDYVFEAMDFPGPISILEGPKDHEAIEMAARLTAQYSDAEGPEVRVECTSEGKREMILVRNT